MSEPGARWALVLVLSTALLGAACTGEEAARSDRAGGGALSGTPAAVTSPPTSDHTHGGPSAPSAPAEIRMLLEQLLGHHAVLMIRLMRGTVDGEADFVAAADSALDRNTDSLRAAVTVVYDEAAGAGFASLWNQHVGSLVDYSAAVADGAVVDRAAARNDLDAYAEQYGEFVSDLTGGQLEAAAVADDVAHHVGHMVDASDAYAAGDYVRAYELERTAYAAMFSTGKALSGAASTQASGELPAGFESAPAELRSALGRLLGEHVELAFDATRAVVTGNPSAEAAADALSQNTSEVLAAMQAALGAETAAEFGEVWADHIDALVRFSVALADGDASAQSRARAELDTFPGRLQGVLPAAAKDAVAANVVIDALQEHDQQLLQQVTAYAAGDFVTAHELAYEGYEHMFAIAGTFAQAIRGSSGGTAPRGGAGTGAGGSVR